MFCWLGIFCTITIENPKGNAAYGMMMTVKNQTIPVPIARIFSTQGVLVHIIANFYYSPLTHPEISLPLASSK